MSAGFNPQYQQYQQYQPQPSYYQAQGAMYQSYPAAPQYQQMQSYPAMQNPYGMQNQQGYNPAPSASAVNIQIFNPVANAAPQYQQMQSYPAMQPAVPMYPTTSLYDPNNGMQNPYPMNYNSPINQTNNTTNVNNNNETNKTDDKKKDDKKKEKVILTDDYIRSLENYLNNQDPKIRLTAAKELLERFKEDDTRKADPALTALLNKVIQDPKASVRYVGLTTLDVGYAQGNSETAEILKQLQNRPDLEYGEDSILASQILLKMSGQKVTIPDNNNSNTNNSNNTQGAAA